MNDGNQSTDTNALDVTIDDSAILRLIKAPLQESQKYWEDEFGLKKARVDNMNLWLPNHWQGKDTYDYQEDSQYADPRTFTSVETISSTVNARTPQLQVMPANDGVVSLQIAKDMQKAGEAYSIKNNLSDLFMLSTRNLQLKRGCFIKLRWDNNKGQHGDVVSELVQAEDTIVDKDAKLGEIPRFFAHRIRNNTLEELIALMPDAEQKLYQMAGFQRRNSKGDIVAYKSQLGKKFDIYEIWFKYLEDGKTKSGVCWTDTNFQHVFDKMPNPYWNYDEEDGVIANLLDEPAPPFIPINYLNDGTKYFDLTSLVEQAAPLQRILDKRGFQIMENADQSGGGLVFNTQMITKEEMGNLVGSPDERVGVKGDVRAAMTRVAPPPLPNYVIEDKQDARNAIDNVFATHAPTRGEASGNKTLGQDNLQQQGDMTRMDDVARAVERQARDYYRYLFQMWKVLYTEEHYFVLDGEDGQFDFVVMKGDTIENGVDIRVAQGSMRPPDRPSMQKWVADLAKLGMIDPLTVFEVAAGGMMPSPKKMLERLMQFKTDPAGFAGIAKEDEFNRDALLDIQILNGDESPKIRPEYSPTYLKFMNNYMMGGEFQTQSDAVKLKYLEHMRIVQQAVQQQLQLLMTQMPNQQELDMQNQKTAQQAALEGQIMQGRPQPTQPGAPGQPQGAAGQPPAAPKPAGQLAQNMAMQRR